MYLTDANGVKQAAVGQVAMAPGMRNVRRHDDSSTFQQDVQVVSLIHEIV